MVVGFDVDFDVDVGVGVCIDVDRAVYVGCRGCVDICAIIISCDYVDVVVVADDVVVVDVCVGVDVAVEYVRCVGYCDIDTYVDTVVLYLCWFWC